MAGITAVGANLVFALSAHCSLLTKKYGPSIYAIGDIHGHLDLLERLLEKLQPDLARDRLVFMGDYIDRGLHPKGVVDYVLRLQRQAPPDHVICLKGNHEAMFLNFLQGRDLDLFLYNGGISYLKGLLGR